MSTMPSCPPTCKDGCKNDQHGLKKMIEVSPQAKPFLGHVEYDSPTKALVDAHEAVEAGNLHDHDAVRGIRDLRDAHGHRLRTNGLPMSPTESQSESSSDGTEGTGQHICHTWSGVSYSAKNTGCM